MFPAISAVVVDVGEEEYYRSVDVIDELAWSARHYTALNRLVSGSAYKLKIRLCPNFRSAGSDKVSLYNMCMHRCNKSAWNQIEVSTQTKQIIRLQTHLIRGTLSRRRQSKCAPSHYDGRTPAKSASIAHTLADKASMPAVLEVWPCSKAKWTIFQAVDVIPAITQRNNSYVRALEIRDQLNKMRSPRYSLLVCCILLGKI